MTTRSPCSDACLHCTIKDVLCLQCLQGSAMTFSLFHCFGSQQRLGFSTLQKTHSLLFHSHRNKFIISPCRLLHLSNGGTCPGLVLISAQFLVRRGCVVPLFAAVCGATCMLAAEISGRIVGPELSCAMQSNAALCQWRRMHTSAHCPGIPEPCHHCQRRAASPN